ncbi:MAG: hypothetical protein ACFE9Z_13505 [Promethearchaeota archaeon]
MKQNVRIGVVCIARNTFDYLAALEIFKKIQNDLKVVENDDWVHIWSCKKYQGGWISVDAPLGKPPVFYKKNSEFSNFF